MCSFPAAPRPRSRAHLNLKSFWAFSAFSRYFVMSLSLERLAMDGDPGGWRDDCCAMEMETRGTEKMIYL